MTTGIAAFTALPLCFSRRTQSSFQSTGTGVKIRFSPNILKDCLSSARRHIMHQTHTAHCTSKFYKLIEPMGNEKQEF